MEPNHQFRYEADSPYPKIQVKAKNPIYARAILDNIGGSSSEMSTISLYLYNHFITTKIDNLSLIFHKISIVEMHHLQIFGELSRQLGEIPRLWTNRRQGKVYWSPSYNQYPSALKPLLQYAIDGEMGAVNKYRQQLQLIDDENVCENLNRIIKDEELHIDIFLQLYKEYCS